MGHSDELLADHRLRNGPTGNRSTSSHQLRNEMIQTGEFHLGHFIGPTNGNTMGS